MPSLEKITYPCSIDSSFQPAFQLLAAGSSPSPLLVALHTWSCTFETGAERYAQLCHEKNWHLIYPNFRGANNTPAGCGSDLAVADIADAAIFMQKNFAVDSSRIYLSGGSGGGHATLLVAGRRPEIWAAASAWCPISDVVAWHRECLNTRYHIYAEHIELACGGNPMDTASAFKEAQKRSPLTYIQNASGFPLDISAGIHDGHTGSVPVSQAINAYNLLAAPEDKISRGDIDHIVLHEQVPEHLLWQDQDPAFGKYKVYLRKQSRMVRLSLFEGGHDMLSWPAFDWLERQQKGQAPDWTSGKPWLQEPSGTNELGR